MRLNTTQRRISWALSALALAFSCVWAGTSLAQEEAPGIFGEVIDVRVVNLEVVVTDRKGNRVVGLQPEDFRLLIDGEEKPIEYFSEVTLGLVAEDAPGDGDDPESGQGASSADPSQAVPSLEPGTPVGTSYLVFIDDFFPLRRDRNKVLESLEKEFGQLRPEDRMAVVAFDGRRLAMLTSWTNSSNQLTDAFREARGRPAHGLKRRQELQSFRSTQGLGGFENVNEDVGERLTPEGRRYVEELTGQVSRTISAASATLRSFAMPPGRKVMLLLSGGWPFDPTQLAAEDNSRPVLDGEFDRGSELFAPLSDTANLLGYTLYPVDVPGLEGFGTNVEDASPTAPGLSPEFESQAALGMLAAQTGGRALLNSLRVRPLETVAADTRSYNWLGFTADRQRDDEAHKIKVEVRNSRFKVRSRKSFLDFSRGAEVSAMVESSLLFGSTPTEEVMPIRLGEAKKAGRRFVELPITLAIPVSGMTVLPVGDRWVSELELRIGVMDEQGNQADMPVIPLRLESDKEPTPGKFVRYDTKLKLRRSKHDLVVAVFDPASGRLATNRVEFVP